jgi:apolipoprotein N-acyltransferase
LWLLFLNALIWKAVTGRRGAGGDRGGADLAAALVWALRMMAALPPDQKPTIAVALVQANIRERISGRDSIRRRFSTPSLRPRQMRAAHPARPSLIIWPETATGSYLRNDLGQAMQVSAFTQRESIPVFSGFPFQRWTDDGRVGARQAPRTVRLGARGRWRWCTRSAIWCRGGSGCRSSGCSPHWASSSWARPNGRRAAARCCSRASRPVQHAWCAFESIFPDLARRGRARRRPWLVNITNDEWFGNSPALYPARGHGAVAARSRITAVVRCANNRHHDDQRDSFGREVARLPVWQAGILSLPLPPVARPTLFTRVGDWPGLLDVIAVLAMMLIAARRALTLRSRPA